ncbi:MAG: diguanylate cyclase [Treponema sp.]|nr:diguanylate cyclase [Treponema sp.]
MKKVALFAHNLTVEYALTVAQGAASYYTEDRDVQLILAQTNQPHYPNGLYEYQYWASAEILNSDDIDLIMIVSSTYQTYITDEELLSFLKPFTKKPVVSIAVDFPFDKLHYTICDCDLAFDQIVGHLKNVHHCKKIGFVSANATNSNEALIRFEAFKKALKKHGFEYNPGWTIEGFFVREAARSITLDLFKSKKDIEFDALVAANDLMAEGCMQALTELGVRVPKDVKIIGFDDITRASFTTPSLSTIDQNIFEQGRKAAEIAHKLLTGAKLPRETKTSASPIYRQSCGCVPLRNTSFTSKNQNGKIIPNRHLNSETLDKYTQHFSDTIGIYTLIDTFHTTHTLKELFGSLTEITSQLKFNSMAVVLYEKPVEFSREDKIEIPDKAYLRTYIDNNHQIIPYDEKGIEINPHKKLIPETYLTQMPGIYILHAIFAGKKQYGYLVVQVPNSKFEMHHIYLKLIINAIAHAYDFNQTLNKNESLSNRNEKLLKNNHELSIQSTEDELTKVLNRRGFMEKAEKELKRAAKNKKSGMVFFADMDGLKKINDTWGHKIGDIAIQTEARILIEAFRGTDIVGRLSGDEFAIVSTGLPKRYISAIRERISQLNKLYSEKANLPLTLSISLGYVEFSPDNYELDDLLSHADQVLYKEKQQKHAAAAKQSK